MTNIDQFESVFKSASKTRFRHQPITFTNVVIVTDLADEADTFAGHVQSFLSSIQRGDLPSYALLRGSDLSTVGELLARIENAQPDLIVTYRNLHSSAWQWPYSLGSQVDVLTQVSPGPVMLLPSPRANPDYHQWMTGTRTVMAITDHLTGDDRLVNYAVALGPQDGRLLLTHVEDEQALTRILDAVAKVPGLDTDTAVNDLTEQLLKEPHDYITSCREELAAAGVRRELHEVVTLGHQLKDHLRIIEMHAVDLAVLNTKDEDQLAMHGLAYPLAIELQRTPILML